MEAGAQHHLRTKVRAEGQKDSGPPTKQCLSVGYQYYHMLLGLFPPIWTAGAEAATPKAVSKCLHFGTAPDCDLSPAERKQGASSGSILASKLKVPEPALLPCTRRVMLPRTHQEVSFAPAQTETKCYQPCCLPTAVPTPPNKLRHKILPLCCWEAES